MNNLRRLFAAFIILLTMLSLSLPVYASNILVNSRCSLEDAITAANTDATSGGCRPGSGADAITLSSDITLDGTLPQITSPIVIEGTGFTISGDDQFQVFYVASSGELTLKNLTVADGHHYWGGAIYNDSGKATVIDSTFTSNYATNGGGAIYNDDLGELTITNSTFNDNSAKWSGGAIFTWSKVTINGSTFVSNSAIESGGGAVHNTWKDFTITNSTFAQNSAATHGGAIYNDYGATYDGKTGYNGNLTITNSKFFSNSAADEGGAIYNKNTLTIGSSRFSGNWALGEGGAIFNSGNNVVMADIAINSSSFVSNSARNIGGAILNNSLTATTITNSTFTDNEAAQLGGAIVNFSLSNLTITNNTISGNWAASDGGLSLFDNASPTYYRLRNNIIAKNTGGDCNTSGSQFTQNVNNLIEDGSCFSSSNLSGDPMLGALTGLPAYFPLLEGSPAIDAGNADHCPATDQRGVTRPQGSGCDIGAYESAFTRPTNTPVPPTHTPTPHGAGKIIVNSLCSLEDAITAANTDAISGGCPAGSGADTIALSSDITLDKTLPQITSPIVIEGAGFTVSGDDQFQVFYVASSGELTLKNLTVADGHHYWGGAIYNDSGKATVIDSTFTNNSATQGGGAIYNDDLGELTITNSTFGGNSATGWGGAIFTWSKVTVSGSTFQGNLAKDSGGAIYNNWKEFTITNSSFTQNVATSNGGAILNGYGATYDGKTGYNGDITITNSSFAQNSAASDGGAIYNKSILTTSGSKFSGNWADDQGGAIFNGNNVSLTVAAVSKFTNSSFTSNYATKGSGGAIYNDDFGKISITSGTFVDNDATGNSASAGGAIYGEDFGEISITGSTFTSNTAAFDGGAILTWSTLTVQTSTFNYNSAGYRGGAILNHWESFTVSDSHFNTNKAQYRGGAIFNSSGTIHRGKDDYYGDLTLHNSSFTDNSALSEGGAIFNLGTVTVHNSSFTRNSSVSNGGAVYNYGAITLRYSSFTDNSTTSHGGAIVNASDADISHSAFTNNSATSLGGAIFNDSNANISNSTFTSNSANSHGGAIASFITSKIVLTNSTISGNKAETGAGIRLFYSDTVNYQLRNNIIAKNTGGDCNSSGYEIAQNVNNLIGDGSCFSPSNLSGDPMLGTLTGSPAYFPLLESSPAIDAGSADYCPATDQRGVIRPQGSGCDIGAYESAFTRPTDTPVATDTPTATAVPTDTPTATATEAGPRELAAPTNLRHVSGSTVAWDAVEGAERYRLRWRLLGQDRQFVTVPAKPTHYTFNGLLVGQTYEVKVRALGDGVLYENKGDWNVMLLTPTAIVEVPRELPPPDNLRHVSGSTVAWDAVEGASRYRLRWGTPGGQRQFKTVAAMETQTSLAGLSDDLTHQVWVRALGDGVLYENKGKWSAVLLIPAVPPPTDTSIPPTNTPLPTDTPTPTATPTPTDTPVPTDTPTPTAIPTDTPTEAGPRELPAPSNLRHVSGSTVAWDAVEGALRYRLRWGLRGGKRQFMTLDGALTQHTFTGLTAGEIYEVWVRALGDGVLYEKKGRWMGALQLIPGSTIPPTATPVPPTATPVPPTATPIPPTATPVPPTATPVPPTATPVPPTATPVPPTATPVPPTATPIPPTATPIPPTATPIPPTATPIPPTDTPIPPTDTPIPPTATPVPPTNTPVPPTNTPVPPTIPPIPPTATATNAP